MEQDLRLLGPKTANERHVLVRLLNASSAGTRVLRWVFLAVLLVLGGASLARATQSLSPEYVYLKDFVQDYLWVRAVTAGADPYRDVTELAVQFFGFLPIGVFPHPNAHPPTTGLLMLPLAWLDYGTAAAVWFALDSAFIFVAAYLMLAAGGSRWRGLAGAGLGLVLLAWYPFHKEIVLGQLSSLVLLLLCGSWLAVRRQRSGLAGVLLGLAIAVKPVPWPLLVVLVVRKEWRAAAGAVGALAIVGLLTVGVLGVDRLLAYQDGLRGVGELHRAEAQNMSLTTVGWRVFQGTRSTILTAISAPPLVDFETGARALSVALPLAVLGVAVVAAWRHRRLDLALGMMLCVSLLISPIAWDHYLVLAAFPIALLVGRIGRQEFDRGAVNFALIAALLLLLPVRSWMDLAVGVSGDPSASTVPFLPALLTYVPSLGVGLLGWLLTPWATAEAEP